MYDATLGRFANIDPLADLFIQVNMSPYQFGWNNPVKYNDPSGECPCIFAIPWVVAAIEALFTTAAVGTAVYTGAKLGEEVTDLYDRRRLTTGTLYDPYESEMLKPKPPRSPEPDWDRANRALKIASATALIIRAGNKFANAWGEKDIVSWLFGKSDEEIDSIIASVGALESSGVQEITDLQFFGAVNPNLVESASSYSIMKEVYEMDRPWLSEEERRKQGEERRRGSQATNLLKQAEAGELESGIYTWDGNNWVRGN